MKKTVLSCLLIISAGGVFAQNADSLFIRRVADEILLHGKAYENLRYLSKQIGPRLAGSQGMVKAEKWGLQLMQESGAGKVWFQECLVPHWVRGGKDEMWSSQIVSANVPGKPDSGLIRKNYDVVALGNSMGTPKEGLTAEVLLVNSFEELDRQKDEAKGKIVFFNYKFNPTFIRTFQSYGDAAKYRGNGPSAAAKYGAAGVIVRSMSHSVDNHPHTGATRYDSGYAKIPAVAVGLRDADLISEQVEKNKLTVTIKTNGYFLQDTIGHNVIGELSGTEFPDEIITVGGHLDCWDNCEGAHDDGAGCVQTIEILRAFKALGYKPKRTIRFVLFANEENGLRGGLKYAEEAKAKNEKHILAIESDAGGFTPRGLGLSGSDEQLKKFMSWRDLIAPYGCSEFSKGGGGADIGPLSRTLGTPMAALQPDSQRYFDVHHARSDVFEAVNKRELELGAVNLAALVYLVDKYGL